MRTVSGPRNRLILVLAALVALAAAVWLAAAAPLGLADRRPRAESVLPQGDSTPATLMTAHEQWVLPVAVIVAVLAVVIGIWLLLAQIPSRPATAPLRFSDAESTVLGALEPAVLERALSEHVEGISGVLDASVRFSGSTTSPWVQASVAIAEDAETSWVAQSVRALLAEDVRTVLGADVRQVDLLIRLRSSAAPSKAVVGPRGRGATARQESPTAPGATTA